MFSAESESLERGAAFPVLRSIFRAEVGVKGNHRLTDQPLSGTYRTSW